MLDNIVHLDLEDKLIIEGVNCKGFGVLPKYVMLDPDLTIDAKTIYAYFCSFSGNGSTSFPSRDKILSDLSINKEAYYKHFHLLTEQGYITVEQEHKKGGRGDGFAKNIYTLVSNPKKFEDKPDDKKQNQAYSRIRFSGLKAAGFGLIPKAVMVDGRLQLKAKGIYAYFCSFSGSGNSAFPKLDKILYHLQIAKRTYYKFYKELIDLNYITVVQRHINGRLSINDYYLTDNPNSANAVKKSVLVADKPSSGNQDANIPLSIHQEAELPPAKPEPTALIKAEDLEDIVYDELYIDKKLPYWYKTDYQRLTVAIHFMTDWKTFYPNGYTNAFQQSIYNLFNEALISMCYSDNPMNLNGALISYSHVIDKLNQLAKFESTYIDLSAFMETAITSYSNAASEREIRNPLHYMKSCIWSAMQAGNISLYSNLKRKGYL